jgi:hypothetical protein
MTSKKDLLARYVRSLSGILMLSGLLFLLISGFWDWHSLVAHIGIALSAAGITTFLVRYDISEAAADNEIRRCGIAMARNGRNLVVGELGDLEGFLRKARPREIDVLGIAMYSLFEPGQLYDTIVSLADEGYAVRVVLADPNSPELALQEYLEDKPGVLKHHIEYIVDAFRKRIANHQNRARICANLKIGYSRPLPKAFILRAGHRMITSAYLGRGPHFSPTVMLEDVPDGFFEDYKEYVDDVINKAFIGVQLLAEVPPGDKPCLPASSA